MSWLALFLGLVLVFVGGAAITASIDLLTTQLGLIYATCGAIAISGGIVTIAIGLLMRRVDALRRAVLSKRETAMPERVEPLLPPLPARVGPATPAEASVSTREPTDSDIAAPSIGAAARPLAELETGPIEEVNAPPPATPAKQTERKPPTLIGRYSAAGANYSIFSDGSIEAETDEGAFKFDSMSEFKAFIADKRK